MLDYIKYWPLDAKEFSKKGKDIIPQIRIVNLTWNLRKNTYGVWALRKYQW